MLAIDTNVLVRLLVADDPAQAERAKALVGREQIFVPVTVLLEAEWVLRSVYGLSGPAVAEAFEALAGLPRVILEDAQRVGRALAWARDGMDFADALHLSRVDGCDALATFDRRLAKSAAGLGALQVRLIRTEDELS
jgi:predicted nucleic-acid-binding protein